MENNPTTVGLFEGTMYLPADEVSDRELLVASVIMSEPQRRALQSDFLGYDLYREFDFNNPDAGDRSPLTEQQALVIHDDVALLKHARKNQERPPKDYKVEVSEVDMAYGAIVNYAQTIGLRPVDARGLEY